MVFLQTMDSYASPGKSRTAGIIITHILLWGLFGFMLLFYQPLSWGVKLPSVFWVKQCTNLLLLLVLFYANYLYFVPTLLFRRQSGWFIGWIFAALVISLGLAYLLESYLHVREQFDRMRNNHTPRVREWVDGFILLTALLVLGISTSIAAVQRWQKDARLSEELQRQQTSAELSFLKAQINPHFFFNTLNSIYALTFTDISMSREGLHKLSRMMRYLLYETQQNEASLQQEINFIKDHIELMKLRLHPNVHVVFQEPILVSDYVIAPMLLFPFVENAFKHGISTTQPSNILIRLSVQENELELQVENPVFLGERSITGHEGGIGLSNTKRRLQLLYPEKYQLKIDDNKDGLYSVTLSLQLS
ncbi:Histidine kinase [bacterium A37T11]|nr:Histidine kinase [bacterium A37T11]